MKQQPSRLPWLLQNFPLPFSLFFFFLLFFFFFFLFSFSFFFASSSFLGGKLPAKKEGNVTQSVFPSFSFFIFLLHQISFKRSQYGGKREGNRKKSYFRAFLGIRRLRNRYVPQPILDSISPSPLPSRHSWTCLAGFLEKKVLENYSAKCLIL